MNTTTPIRRPTLCTVTQLNVLESDGVVYSLHNHTKVALQLAAPNG